MLYKFSSLDDYQDSIHYWGSFTATITIVKFLLLLSTTSYSTYKDATPSLQTYRQSLALVIRTS